MPEQLLTILKFLLIALLYLFFLRVLRVVWTEVREPVTAAAAQPAAATPARPRVPRRKATRRQLPTALVVTAPPDQARPPQPLQPEMTIGRGGGCTVSVEDGYVSTLHSRVFQREGVWMVEDLGSTNGTYLNRRKVTGPTALAAGDRISLGNVEIEVR